MVVLFIELPFDFFQKEFRVFSNIQFSEMFFSGNITKTEYINTFENNPIMS